MIYIETYRPGHESAMTATYIAQNPKKVRECKQVFETADEMLKAYSSVLSIEEVQRARLLRWGRRSAEEYLSMFRRLVLMDYKVWEISREEIFQRYNVLKKNNPEWAELFMKDHNRKLERYAVAQRKAG